MNTIKQLETRQPEPLSFMAFVARIDSLADAGCPQRLGMLTARRLHDALRLVAVVIDPQANSVEVIETGMEAQSRAYPSFTPRVPMAHWYERAIHDMFGLVPEGHPRFKSLILHEAWPADFFPLRGSTEISSARSYAFLEVKGEGVMEIPVGPIHAGIIEPGHFRFSCVGEVIENLEIRLGYQHRGVERHLTEVPWQHARYLAEAASSDTTVGNAWAHARAVEDMSGTKVPVTVELLRAAALEIERLACHLGDLGGICGDIGFAGGASIFGRLRGQALGLGERLSGARFLGGFIRPGGVSRMPTRADVTQMLDALYALQAEVERAIPLLLDNPSALDRMEGIGRVRPSLARDFGLVGPAGRASGVEYDVRAALRQEPYASLGVQVPTRTAGDVLSRIEVRADEMVASVSVLHAILSEFEFASPDPISGIAMRLPPNSCGVGVVEAWRGELIHLIFSDSDSNISRYAIKDPSFNNWTGLAIAARGELVSDFPLCNKSFSLSYSGNDL